MSITNNPIYKAIHAAFVLEESQAACDSASAAQHLSEILVAFSGQLARDMVDHQNKLAGGCVHVVCEASAPARAGKSENLATGEWRGGAKAQEATFYHPATDDFYASADYPLDGCTLAVTVRGQHFDLAVHRPGSSGAVGEIERYADCEIANIGGFMHTFVAGRVRV